ncbi:hypothetical protein Vafri_20864 [Volvox africanus]|uniref:Uncharacterized protein n=1 Tax=Volvox africanus TaxID=51714 RepID=A0A8J4FA10_9CHLO|nr:hypothetical protein Vafri_20864 [Volvox africanus]
MAAGGNASNAPAPADSSGATAASAAADADGASVAMMAQSAFKSLLDGAPPQLTSMLQSGELQGGFRLDHDNRLIDVMPVNGDNIRKALESTEGARLADMAQTAGAFRNQQTSGGRMMGVVRDYRRNAANEAGKFVTSRVDLKQQLAADQVAAYVQAVQSASELVSSRLRESADSVVAAMQTVETAAQQAIASGQLTGALRDGSTSLGAALLDKWNQGPAGAMRALANQLYTDSQNSMQMLLNAYRAKVDATSNVAQAAGAALTNVAGAKYGMSMESLNRALARLSSGLDKMAARGGPVAAGVATTKKRALDMLKASAGQFRSMLQAADSPSVFVAAAPEDPAGGGSSAAASGDTSSASDGKGQEQQQQQQQRWQLGAGVRQRLAAGGGGGGGGISQRFGAGVQQQFGSGIRQSLGSGSGADNVRQQLSEVVGRLQGLEDRIVNLRSRVG